MVKLECFSLRIITTFDYIFIIFQINVIFLDIESAIWTLRALFEPRLDAL